MTLLLGSIGAAHHREGLHRCGITHVLTVAGGFPPRFPGEFTYCNVDVKDVPEVRLGAINKNARLVSQRYIM